MLLVAAYWRNNLTPRQLALLFGVSKSAAKRIATDLGCVMSSWWSGHGSGPGETAVENIAAVLELA
jgi:Helix-turn-helix of DDE superfamily endonuclease